MSRFLLGSMFVLASMVIMCSMSAFAEEGVSSEGSGTVTETPSLAPSARTPDVVAMVAGEPITRQDYERAIRQTQNLLRAQSAARGKGVSRTLPQLNGTQMAQVLEGLIATRVSLKLASEAGMTVSEEQLDQEVEKAREEMSKYGDGAFEDALEAQGMTPDSLRKELRVKLLREQFEKDLVKDTVVTDEELKAEYDRLRAQGGLRRNEKSADVKHVLIAVSKDADEAEWKDAKQRMTAIRDRIVGGEDFSEVAKEVSDDPGVHMNAGAYPNVSSSSRFPRAFVIMALTTKEGSISPPVRTQAGWHIIQVTALHEAGPMPFEEVQERLGRVVLSQRQQELMARTVYAARARVGVEVFYNPEKDPANSPDLRPFMQNAI